MKNLLNLLLEWFGAPPLIKELRRQLLFLEERLKEMEQERVKMQDSFLLRNGVQPLYPESLPPAEPNPSSTPFEEWKKQDIKAEIEELKVYAQRDPDTFNPLIDEALIRYRNELR